MKDGALSGWAVVTADQRGSRRLPDAVPVALNALGTGGPGTVRMVLPFERTAGDEIQALTDDPSAVVAVIRILTRIGGWRIGVGLGEVDTPLPVGTRQARGPAYVSARSAVEASRSAPGHLAVRRSGPPTDPADPVWRAESALLVVRSLMERRTEEGWRVVDLLDAGLSNQDAARRLGISPSAASQRATRAAHAEVRRGLRLARDLLAEAMTTAVAADAGTIAAGPATGPSTGGDDT